MKYTIIKWELAGLLSEEFMSCLSKAKFYRREVAEGI